MDHILINSLATQIKSKTARADEALRELKGLLTGWLRYRYNQWRDGLPIGDFDTIAESVFDFAVTTYKPEEACFATWATCQLRALITEEIRQKCRARSLSAQEQFKLLDERAVNPFDKVAQDDLVELTKRALEKESELSLVVVWAFIKSYPPLSQVAVLIGKSVDNARQIRYRNIKSIRKSVSGKASCD